MLIDRKTLSNARERQLSLLQILDHCDRRCTPKHLYLAMCRHYPEYKRALFYRELQILKEQGYASRDEAGHGGWYITDAGREIRSNRFVIPDWIPRAVEQVQKARLSEF